MTRAKRDGGSFRDPRGYVFHEGDRVYRSVADQAAAELEFVWKAGLLARLVQAGRVVETEQVDPAELPAGVSPRGLLLRHRRVPFVSYPYEWSFPLLKSAALLHLDVQIEALSADVALADASAYNVQFFGATPRFIDVLSFRPYRDGEVWAGYRQFCEQFLNPLLLRALLGIPHNAWFRGTLEGIETIHLDRMLPWWRSLWPKTLAHVTLQAALHRKAALDPGRAISTARTARLPRQAFAGLLASLRAWIAGLEPRDTGPTTWQRYAEATTYRDDEHAAKRRFVADFCERTTPETLWDFGCNSGEYAEVALASGARRVIGFDVDHGALEGAWSRAQAKSLDLLPLHMDSANPSPDQGWAHRERKGLASRGQADAVLALAFEHHLAIGRNVPLPDVVDWIVAQAPQGVVEFVRKDDPTIRQMLALREDVFAGYTQQAFEDCLRAQASIVRSETVSASGRTLYWFARDRRANAVADA